MSCHVCKKEVIRYSGVKYDYKCEWCPYALCRDCDDRSAHLKWWEGPDGVDRYLCEPCIKIGKDLVKKEKKAS